MSSTRIMFFRAGVVLAAFSWALGAIYMHRAKVIGGFWNHMSENDLWLRAGLAVALLSIILSLFGRGFSRIAVLVVSSLALVVWLGFGMAL
ncbi:hypothetical protein HDF12_001318 [Edaphobacter lichenicola]|uniref:Uncharacterized protein n=2 Tax=Tunturiibacter TaxID=3154218 RepID=A0A7Y9T1W8_9BACT|nr:hypothetical protein [Edaphobacter lichenicola]NYF50953.1 hypothetical protein [Edaphobacter lichenicola]